MSSRKRLFALLYYACLSDHGHPNPDDPLTRDVRAPLLAQAHGKVLEIGAGDGANLPLYPSGVEITLLDPNPYLLKYAPGVAARHSIQVATVEAIAERLPFPGDHFDTVVSTHVLCSVRDQSLTLAEVQRVLRPGGLFLFLEHISAPPRTPTYRLQRLLNPLWRTIGDGCHLTRHTGKTICDSGFQEVQLRHYEAGFPSFVSLHIVGSAINNGGQEGRVSMNRITSGR